MKGTVYECKPGGTIEALQAYYDPNVSVFPLLQSGQVQSSHIELNCLHLFPFQYFLCGYSQKRSFLCANGALTPPQELLFFSWQEQLAQSELWTVT